MTYRVLYTAPFTSTLMRLLGALIMLPFGLGLATGLFFGVPSAVVDLYAEAKRDWTTLLLSVPTTLLVGAFGAFLTYALLRHGGASFLDLFGARKTIVGTITNKRSWSSGKGGRMYGIDVDGESMTVSEDAYEIAREGMSVRATCGRFERDLTELAELET